MYSLKYIYIYKGVKKVKLILIPLHRDDHCQGFDLYPLIYLFYAYLDMYLRNGSYQQKIFYSIFSLNKLHSSFNVSVVTCHQ